MPLKEKTIERVYWTIGEVATQLGVNTSLLRYWEKEFGTLRPKRTGKGDRLYTKDDIAKIRAIQQLLKEQGFTIQGAKERIRTARKSADPSIEVVQRLQRVREALVELQAAMEAAVPERMRSVSA